MATPNSSQRLRTALDAVTTPRHEIAFGVLDLHRSQAHHAEQCERSRVRARELAAAPHSSSIPQTGEQR